MDSKADTLYLDLGRDYEQETQSPFTDSLTGLHNHGFFMEELKREVILSRRTGSPFCLALIDVDGFKLQNQKHGTIHGDKILKDLGGVLKATARASDLCARYMGDQFILLLQEMTTETVETFFQRLEAATARQFQNEMTVCIGCVSSADGHDAEDLMTKAKEALLQAKLLGRGKHSVSSPASQESDPEVSRVLVVDDEPTNVKLLEAMLRHLKYEVHTANNGQEALQAVAQFDIDLILLDAMMPVMDGFETCRRLKTNGSSRMIPVIVVTALDDRDSKVKAIESGADDFMTKPPDRIELMARIRALLRTKKLNESLVSIENVLFSLANAVEAKDAYTEGHVKRVANLAVHLGRQMKLPERDLEALRVGGILHDVGKIGIPDAVLNKPGKLDDEEWKLMKAHPDVGYRMAEPLRPILKGALDAIRHHHEKLDGSGYPDGIKGADISIIARIMAAADIWDALVTDRPYRRGMNSEEALSLMEKDALEGRLDEGIIDHLGALIRGIGSNAEDGS
jgi:putative two-component system response regulator